MTTQHRSEHYDTIYKMVSEGYRVNEIREKLNNAISRQRVSQIRETILDSNPDFKKVFIDKQNKIYSYQVEYIKENIDKISPVAIAGVLKISKSRVYEIMKAENIEKSVRPKRAVIEENSRYGLWKVGKMFEKRDESGNLIRFYHCVCMGCNKPYEVRQSNLLSGNTSSCQACRFKAKQIAL